MTGYAILGRRTSVGFDVDFDGPYSADIDAIARDKDISLGARVGDISDTKTDYDRGEQLCLAMNQAFNALGRPKEFEAQAELVWKEYEDAKAGLMFRASEKWLNATKMKNAGIDAAKLTEDLKKAYPAKMAAAPQTNVPEPSKPSMPNIGEYLPWIIGGAIVIGIGVTVMPIVGPLLTARLLTRHV